MESRKQQIEDADIPQGILQIMNFIFSQSLNKQNISQMVGISVECNRIDLLEKALRNSQNLSDSLYQLLNLVQDFSYPEHVRERLIHLLSSLYHELNDYYGVFRCHLLLCDLQGSMSIIITYSTIQSHSLVASLFKEITPTHIEIAYQMAFDIAAMDDRGFVTALLPLLPPVEETGFDQLRSILQKAKTNQL